MAKNNLKRILEQEGINQIELANEIGMAYGTINKICNQHYTPKPTSMSKILKGLIRLAEKEFEIEVVFPNSKKHS